MQNSSFNVNGLNAVFPLDNSLFDGIECLDAKLAMQPVDLFADSSS